MSKLVLCFEYKICTCTSVLGNNFFIVLIFNVSVVFSCICEYTGKIENRGK